MLRGEGGQDGQKTAPDPRMGEATEEAGDGVGAAVLRREGGPGERGEGVGEDGVHAGAGTLRDRAAAVAGVVREVGGEGGPLRVGQGVEGEGGGGAHGRGCSTGGGY